MTAYRFEVCSTFSCSKETLLRALTMRGVNQELMPLVYMTYPSDWADRAITDWPTKQPLFSSWILLFGFLPIDRHQFYFSEVNPEWGFKEASSSWMNRTWRHHRHIVEEHGASKLTDTLEYSPLLSIVGWLLQPIYRQVFLMRHRHLRKKHKGRSS